MSHLVSAEWAKNHISMGSNMIGGTNLVPGSDRKNAVATGIWRAAATIVIAVALFLLIVHFASYEAVKAHVDEFIFGVFTFGIGVVVSLFVSKEDGFRLPNREILTRRAPAGFAALAFVVGAEVWWGQWSRYHELSATLADVCERAKEAPESSEAKITLLTKAQRSAEAINGLWLKPASVEVEPCYH